MRKKEIETVEVKEMVSKKIMVLILFCSFICLPVIAQEEWNFSAEQEIGQSATIPDTKKTIQKVLQDPSFLRIPENYGSIKEVWTPPVREHMAQKLIIHIQDAHCNYEAQTNISKILDFIMNEYPDQIKLVAVEGSVGVIDTSPFAEFSDKEIKREVADYFMRKGKITGPEFLSITGDHEFELFGIEDKELYDRNYKAFLDSLNFREESDKYCGYLDRIFNQLKRFVYTPELQEFDSKLVKYREGDMNFLDYVIFLKEWAEKYKVSLQPYRNFSILLKAQEMEDKIDFDVVEKERARLIDKLGRALPKEKLSELVMKSLHFRLGKVTTVEYYGYLEKIVDKLVTGKEEIDKADFPNLFLYIEYVKLHNSMDKTELFTETARIENVIAEKLFRNRVQKQLFTLSKHTGILKRMFKLELVKDDYIYYKNHKELFRIEAFLNFIKVQAPRFGISFYEDPGLYKINDNLPIIEEFYEAAIARDPVLINNMLAEMDRLGVNVCVLVAGGFHTKGLTEILQGRKLSYAVISPRITKKPEYNPYIDIMTGKKTPFEQFLEQLGEE